MKQNLLIVTFVILLALLLLLAGTYAFLTRQTSADGNAAELPFSEPPQETAEPPAEATGEPEPEPELPEAAPAPTAEPSPSAEPEATGYDRRAEELLANMSLREKIAQMLIVYPSDWLSDVTVGGLVYSEADVPSREGVISSISDFQNKSDIALFICADEEGGTVTRTRNIPDIPRIGSMMSYKDEGTDTAYSNALTIAGYMSELGFNLDLAPVADVHANANDTVIASRAYSDDFAQAAELIPYAVAGFHEGGVACCLKHFPGHGSAGADTHFSTAVVSKTKDELLQEDLLPFIAGIQAGADMVMSAHLTMTAIDPALPASLSANVITGFLRGELGYDGVVITDGLEMSAVSGVYTADEIAVMAVKAGNDILLGPEDAASAIAAIENAVADGALSEERINESVLRILRLKLERQIIE